MLLVRRAGGERLGALAHGPDHKPNDGSKHWVPSESTLPPTQSCLFERIQHINSARNISINHISIHIQIHIRTPRIRARGKIHCAHVR